MKFKQIVGIAEIVLAIIIIYLVWNTNLLVNAGYSQEILSLVWQGTVIILNTLQTVVTIIAILFVLQGIVNIINK